ncbi:Hypothetical predicted protein [Podarcis lilfordi]|uniref:Uncharacterized protein n=1 Tax=Podarcis lilfordi TaxID=74358 RepID=A0AA35LMB2_9SAUR|nr:Hypothetical predicted protein [Podarcis lilfordi]
MAFGDAFAEHTASQQVSGPLPGSHGEWPVFLDLCSLTSSLSKNLPLSIEAAADCWMFTPNRRENRMSFNSPLVEEE